MQSSGPNFICIGAQKAGTTWLSNQLKVHPDIWIPPQKELHYFDRNRKYSSSNYLSVTSLAERLKDEKWAKEVKSRLMISIDNKNAVMTKWWSKYYFSNYSDDWYLSLFDGRPEKVTGELTPAYSILNPEDVVKMANLLPETKIIFLVRNPILRAWSMLRFADKQGKTIDFNDVESLIKHTNARGQAHRSNYIRTLENYSKAFGEDRILLCFYDAISLQPGNLIQKVLSFLEVDPTATKRMKLDARSNVSPRLEMPEAVLEHLKKKYRDSIRTLSKTYGSYFSVWEDMLENPSHEYNNDSFASALKLCND